MYDVLCVQGSPHLNGNTHRIFEEFLRRCEEEGVTYRTIDASEQDIQYFCSDCGACSKEGYCVIPDDIKGGLKSFNDCRALVIFTPIYFYQMTGQTKTVLDRLGGCRSWKNKKLFLYSVSGSDTESEMSGFDLLNEVMRRTAIWHSCEYVAGFNYVTHDKWTEDLERKDEVVCTRRDRNITSSTTDFKIDTP